MSKMLLFPFFMYFIDCIVSCVYTRDFLKGKYGKRAVLAAWGLIYFFIEVLIFEIVNNRFPLSEAAGIILNVCILLFLQFLFFEKDMQKQIFVSVSFVTGKEIVKYIASVFSAAFTEVWNRIVELLLEKEMINTFEKLQIWTDVTVVVIAVICSLLYVLLLAAYLFSIDKKFVRKDHLLQIHENIFLILPCLAALCISVTIKMMVVSIEDGMTVMIYDTVPETKFWIPVICTLLLATIIASVILFQKVVEYNEEIKKRALLENQVWQMQKEIEEIQDIYADMRGLRHDMRGHLANISLLVRNTAGAQNEELESYIGKMEETVKKLDFHYQTGNPITDIIIHQKGQEAEKRQIEFVVDFVYPSKLLIDVYDIAVILNNALENAIEACCKVKNAKQIKLHSCVKGSLFFIEVENDFEEKIIIEQKSGFPVTSKDNGKLHGIGISNIQRCAKKYVGDIDIEISNTCGRKKFSLTVMMKGKTGAGL